MSSQRFTGMIHACVCVCRKGGWGGGGKVVGVSCVSLNVYVCICHLRDSKKIFLASKDKNNDLKS